VKRTIEESERTRKDVKKERVWRTHENRPDQLQQILPTLNRLQYQLPLLVRDLVTEEQLADTEDGSDGRADFV
jgi:hypothetical protein